MKDQRIDRDQCEEHREQGQQLARQGDEPAAAGAAQPGAPAAARELRADGVAGGDRDHHVEHGRHDGADQERGIVGGGVGQNILLDQQGAAEPGRRLHRACRRQPRGNRGDRVAQPLGRDVARREVLRVVESDDLRPAAGQQVGPEIRWNVDRRDGGAGANGAGGRRQAVGALGHLQARRRGDRLDEFAGDSRAVGVDDDDIEAADDRVAEGPGEHGEGDQRHRQQQEQAGMIAPEEPDLPRGHQPQARARRPLHGERRVQSA